MTHECEGACDERGGHVGDVRRVNVKDAPSFPNGAPQYRYNWGEFWYCQTAIDEDRRRGLLVTEEPA